MRTTVIDCAFVGRHHAEQRRTARARELLDVHVQLQPALDSDLPWLLQRAP